MIKKIVSVLCVAAMLVSMLGITVSADPAAPAFGIAVDPIKDGDKQVTATVYVTLPEGATGYELGSFGLELNYNYGALTLAGEPEWMIGGNAMASGSVFAKPYKLLWVGIEPEFEAGINPICTLTFDLALAAKEGQEYNFSLAIDENNGVCSMPSQDGTYTETAYPADAISLADVTAVVEKATVYGDVDGDGKVILADVTEVLKYIAKWQGVDINTTAADVNCDEAVNLNDVTLMLQSIAKWDVTLGPKA